VLDVMHASTPELDSSLPRIVMDDGEESGYLKYKIALQVPKANRIYINIFRADNDNNNNRVAKLMPHGILAML